MPEQRSEQPNLPGFSETDLMLLRMNETQRCLGLPELKLEDLLPPKPDHWPTTDELREADSREPRRGMVCIKGGIRPGPLWPRIKYV